MSKFIAVTPDSFFPAINSQDRSVGVHVYGVGHQLGLADDVILVLRLSSEETRLFAQALLRTADEAEAESPLQPCRVGTPVPTRK